MPFITKIPGNLFALTAIPFFLSFFLTIGGVHAEELTEADFFEESFETEDSFELEDSGDSFESDFGLGEEGNFVEKERFFKSSEFEFTDNRSYISSPRKRERLRDFQDRPEFTETYFKSYFKGMFSDLEYITTSPYRWDRTDWMTAGLVAGGTGFFIGLDEDIKNFFDDIRSSTTDDLANIFEPFGNGIVTIPALAGFYLFGHFDENYKAKRTALIATESFLITGLYTTILKVTLGRHRPSTGSSSTAFDGFTTDNKSFPSGHTSTAFAIATVVANEYEETPYIKPVSYGIATLTGLSRINDEKHWASDVFFGAALGYFVSKTILHLHENRKGKHFTIYPRVDNNGGGLVLSKRF
ncbi:MAG: phosphatase PAP2 family protein [Nitrospinae bacterium]|nr:phosphatase PAP2 family protein [Nitrospinota bacterium]MZH04781.1 phosphatase PAP2 family protein [Nitrospinota bacterium]MZH13193.1 phosphatase PAP2 family protein [Nitrospinota bacterium]